MDRGLESKDNKTIIEEVSNFHAKWALNAMAYAESHMSQIKGEYKFNGFTKKDGQLYKNFREHFPHMKIHPLSHDDINGSEETCKKWRTLLLENRGDIDIYNFGTLLRLDCKGEYDKNNVAVVPRLQFYMIEAARNEEGYNPEHMRTDRK